MKSVVLMCLVFLFVQEIYSQNTVTHQRVFDTIPYIPAHHASRLALFEKEPMNKGAILFLGNSITEGGAWTDLLGTQNIINRGIGGDIAYGILNRLDEIIEREPSKLFFDDRYKRHRHGHTGPRNRR